MLHLFAPPFSLRSGNDVFGPRTVQMFRQCNIDSRYGSTSPDFVAKWFNSGNIPFGRRIFRNCIVPLSAKIAVRMVQKGDIAWFLEPALPQSESIQIEYKLKRQGTRYVFHVMDDWFSIPNLRDRTIRLCRLADLIVVPTPILFERVRKIIPQGNIVRLEEPIDVCRVYPIQNEQISEKPCVIWCGGPVNMRFLKIIKEPMEKAAKIVPFRLRIISGLYPKQLNLNFEWEWCRYDYMNEARLLSNGVCGIAPLDDSPYNECKGAYKIKTYFAAGMPVIASPVGYQKELMDDGENGFLCKNFDEWVDSLVMLLRDINRRNEMGVAARKQAYALYSHDAVSPSWCSAIRPFILQN